tara:strand:- start:818 stop:1366 length:549 start_codon:yes stop_codon:yes gene_type:complete
MGTIGQDFNYKVIKNFLSKDEINLFKTYSEIKHITNIDNFDLNQNDNGDTCFYGDPIMESLMINKLDLMQTESGKDLLPTYTFWRCYTKYSDLKKHTDRPSCQISVTVNISGDGTRWPIFMEGTPIHLNIGDAAIYLGCKVPHWREEFSGDFQVQAFLHYVDKHGEFKDYYMDKRPYWGIKK